MTCTSKMFVEFTIAEMLEAAAQQRDKERERRYDVAEAKRETRRENSETSAARRK